MKLYFEENSYTKEPKRTYIGESRVESILDNLMYQDMENRNIKPPYLRYFYCDDNEICIDYGSHSNFYILVPSEDKDTEVPDEEGNGLTIRDFTN